ncbi:MAG TPA: alanine racemase [Phycisphaerae bacterium]|nr:alanine racemase [Phycisphaerae bacterium]
MDSSKDPSRPSSASGGDRTEADGSCLTAEISASAVRDNLAQLRALLPAATKICAVAKADCYGHAIETLLGTITAAADWLAVATPGEALHLRELRYAGPVLMFFPPCSCASAGELSGVLCRLIAAATTLTVTSADELPAIAQAARAVGCKAEVHVKIDTGMCRGGVPAEKAAALVRQVRREHNIHLGGLYTHFASADEADKSSTHEQFRRFMKAVDECGGRGELCLHAANSAATIDVPETHLDMVRPGIAIYGYQPSDEMQTHLPLRPSLRLTGRLMQVKDVPAGSRCGYGLTHTFERAARVGLVPIGYADGYMRRFAGAATVRVGGTDAPVRGRVSMDQIIVELTDLPGTSAGQEVEIISPDPAAPHSVESLARLAGTIPYEITCRLGNRIRRVLVS